MSFSAVLHVLKSRKRTKWTDGQDELWSCGLWTGPSVLGGLSLATRPWPARGWGRVVDRAATNQFADNCVQAKSAWDLSKAWGAGLRLTIVDDAGHSAQEKGINRLLVAAADEFKALQF